MSISPEFFTIQKLCFNTRGSSSLFSKSQSDLAKLEGLKILNNDDILLNKIVKVVLIDVQ